MSIKPNRYFQAGIAILALMGMVTILALTRWGPGLLDLDSFNYVSAARNLAAGKGLQIFSNSTLLVPMTHYPPLFPLLLAFFELLGIDAIIAARWLNAFLFGINLVIFVALSAKVLKSRILSLVSGFLFLLSVSLLEAHAWVLSEPLLTFFFLSALLIYHNWRKTNQNIWLALLYAATALAVLTKFIGIALAISLSAAFLMNDSKQKGKFQRATAALMAGLAPFILWTARSYWIGSALNERELGYTPLTSENLLSFFQTFATWFIPVNWLQGREILTSVLGITLLLGISAILMKKWKYKQLGPPPLMIFSLLLLEIYIVTVFIAKVFFDPGIGFQNRMFMPIFPMVLILILWLISLLLKADSNKIAAIGAGALIYLLFAAFVASSARLPKIYDDGLGWNKRTIQQSTALVELRAIPSLSQDYLFTNDKFGLYFLTEQAGYNIAQFPSKDLLGEAYLIIFKKNLSDQHPLIANNQYQLTLIADDAIFSLHSFNPD
jgi:4-amino-4-deoxy-L-arabinose transferase-like glycosyltransferase